MPISPRPSSRRISTSRTSSTTGCASRRKSASISRAGRMTFASAITWMRSMSMASRSTSRAA
ncbi:hypothetical protein, partial [Erythrobacter sp.]|uniref:hypothetical protein n=1 Tax=Erythrobacter sp. TaxID=1042 RepID=UPI003530221D